MLMKLNCFIYTVEVQNDCFVDKNKTSFTCFSGFGIVGRVSPWKTEDQGKLGSA